MHKDIVIREQKKTLPNLLQLSWKHRILGNVIVWFSTQVFFFTLITGLSKPEMRVSTYFCVLVYIRSIYKHELLLVKFKSTYDLHNTTTTSSTTIQYQYSYSNVYKRHELRILSNLENQ